MNQLKQYIREVPNFPKPGVRFYDITTLFENPIGLKLALDAMQDYVASRGANKIAGVEARGFILGAALADRLGLGFVAIRKAGKLPAQSISEDYQLEYGEATLEMHTDAVAKDDKVVVVDDLVATGGSLGAACRLIERCSGTVAGISTIIALTFLPFANKLSQYDINYLISYDSE